MTVYEWLLHAGREAWRRYRAEPVAFTAALFAALGFFRVLMFVVEHSLSGKHALLDVVLVVLVYFPLCVAAATITARLYLRRRQGLPWSLGDLAGTICSRPFLSLVGRLTGVTVAWYAAAMLLAALIGILADVRGAILFGIGHPGLKPVPMHHPHPWFTVLALVLVCFPVSRYTFVVPLFATGEVSGKEAMRSGVKLARGSFVALSLLALLSLALSYGFGHPMRQLENGPWVKRFAVELAALLESSVVYSMAGLVGAELAYSKWIDGDVGEAITS